MLRYPLIHPEMIGALATAGHGSQVLIVDGNYPHATGVNPAATLVYLNLRPGLVTVEDVLAPVLSAIEVEGATVMRPDDAIEPEIFGSFREQLPALELVQLERHDFYAAACGRDVALAVATGEERWYANILLTIAAITPPAG
jgi:L-fucose mutarotase